MALLSIYDHKPCHRPKSNLAEMRFTRPRCLLKNIWDSVLRRACFADLKISRL